MNTGPDMNLGNLIADWHVYIFADKNMFAGKLAVYDKGVGFRSHDDLKSDATAIAGALTFGVGVAKKNYRDFTLSYDEIASVEVKKQLLIMQNLVITTKVGDQLTFRFGVLSPKKAVAEIQMRIS